MKKKRKSLGQVVNRQHSGGLSVADFWAKLFQENQENFTAGKLDKILLDEQITEAMGKAFPDRKDSAIFKQPNRVRNRYNRGVLTKNQVPKQKSVKFQRKDSLIVPQKTSFLGKKRKIPEKD